MKQVRLLLIGSTSEFMNIAKCAKEMGFYLIICDGYKTGVARNVADKCYEISVNEVEKIVELCKEEEVDYVIGSFSDYLFEQMITIANKADLPRYIDIDKLDYFRNKEKMGQMLEALEIDYPKSKVVNKLNYKEVLEENDLPLVIKPIAGWGSRGVELVQSNDEMQEYFQKAEEAQEFIAQEFNQNTAYNFTVWIANSKATKLYLESRHISSFGNGNKLPILKYMYLVHGKKELEKKLLGMVQKIADFAGIENGPLALQLWADEDNNVQICEVAARILGYDQYLGNVVTNLKPSELLLRSMVEGNEVENYIRDSIQFESKYISTIYISIKDRVIISSEEFRRLLDNTNIVFSKIFIEDGTSASYWHESFYAVIIFKAESFEELKKVTETFHENMAVYDEQGENILIK